MPCLLLIARDVLSEVTTQKLYNHTCYVLEAMVRKIYSLTVVIKA